MRLTKSDKEAFVRAVMDDVLAELTNLGWPKGEPYAAAV